MAFTAFIATNKDTKLLNESDLQALIHNKLDAKLNLSKQVALPKEFLGQQHH